MIYLSYCATLSIVVGSCKLVRSNKYYTVLLNCTQTDGLLNRVHPAAHRINRILPVIVMRGYKGRRSKGGGAPPLFPVEKANYISTLS